MNKRPPLYPGPKRRRVISTRHSDTGGVPLADLDWSNWWTDSWPDGSFYLHVEHIDKDDGRVIRVYCRATDKPRLRMIDGELYWLIDSPREVSV